MTQHKHLKQLIRTRMEKTGERYATARRQIIRQNPAPSVAQHSPNTHWHIPGNIPAITALRALLGHASMHNPVTGQPFSEAMLFGIAGGIGIGVFTFYYEKEDFATFFIAGRHSWHNDATYLLEATQRVGAVPIVQESGGRKEAETQLRHTLAAYGPCIAWVDSASLPHRAAPTQMTGSGYHVITIYHIDDQAQTALIGDLTDEPISIPLTTLAQARARIKKDRQRLLSITNAGAIPPLQSLVNQGLQACYAGLEHPTLPGAQANGRITALATWADRMEGSKGKERWEHIFRRGPNLLRGLCAINDFVEHYGTGGGLCRPLFADFLQEAAELLNQPALNELAMRYTQLGQQWSDLADAALPDGVPLLHQAKHLLTRKAELLHAGGSTSELHAIWQELAAIEQQAQAEFPLTEADCTALRTQLREQILNLYQREAAALIALGGFLAE